MNILLRERITKRYLADLLQGNTVLTAQTVRQWLVTFKAGENGSLEGSNTPTLVDDDGGHVTNIPAPVANPGYVFDNWTSDSATIISTDTAITEDVTFTANFEDGTYDLIFSGETSGLVDAAVGENGQYYVPGDQIIGDVTVTYDGSINQDDGVTPTDARIVNEVLNFKRENVGEMSIEWRLFFDVVDAELADSEESDSYKITVADIYWILDKYMNSAPDSVDTAE